MPTYVYRREDGTTFEIEQRISEDPLAVCPTTGQPVKRVISGGTGLIFKGSGFYLTDYARQKNGAANGSDAKPAEAKTPDAKTPDAKTAPAGAAEPAGTAAKKKKK
ncbi:MAG: FmdB family zinc ribbon protein [Rhodothermales bacterium]|nr:FmdB family zinc ribbon protein [Rhodothermales bacterium]